LWRSANELILADSMCAQLAGRRTRRVLVHGLVYFGQVFADFMTGDGWDFRYFPDHGLGNLLSMTEALRQCDLVYQIGGRVTVGKFLGAARLFGKNRVVMHWVGSDTLDQKAAAAAGRSDPWVLSGIHHWADSQWIHQEVTSLGLPSKLVPLPSPRIPNETVPLPDEFSVLVYVPSVERSELYGLDMILEAARQLPQVKFELVGLRDGPVANPPDNIRFHKRLPNLVDYYRDATVVWRPARHDGLSWMVLEGLGYGRHVLWTYPFRGCIRSTTASEAICHIKRLHQLHQHKQLMLNQEGASFIAASEYYPKNFRADIHARLEKILAS
jgi:hypothetical protein